MTAHGYSITEVDLMIQDCELRESKLNDWEASFISNIGDVHDHYGVLSEKQIEILNKIWERIT